ncbi:UNVERIFIED_CONTAM: hypothetical protein FKN15_069622 [Acipenser sinensis]
MLLEKLDSTRSVAFGATENGNCTSPAADQEMCSLKLPAVGVKAVCPKVGVGEYSIGLADRSTDQLGVSPHAIPEVYSCPVSLGHGPSQLWTREERVTAQQKEPGMKWVWEAVAKWLLIENRC